MLPKYKCPTCCEEFSRKWNMRTHCKSQHDYDPIPPEDPKKYGFSDDLEVDSNYYEAENAIQRVVTMMKDFSKIQELGRGGANAARARSGASRLNELVDDYIIINKRDISGISGYLCSQCLSFQFRYIMDIGRNLTARGMHRCNPQAVKISNTLQNRNQRYDELVAKATDCLVALTNLVFYGKVDLVVISSATRLANYHGSLIKLDQITPDHWLWKSIDQGKIQLTDIELRKFLERMKLRGTYAKILIEHGSYSGYYLMYIKRREFNVAKSN